jgi:hypothetical protein
MKKAVMIIGIGLVLLLLVAVGLGWFFLDPIVKKAVETVGPNITKVELKLDSVGVSILNGSGTLKGFFLGNPGGFKTPSAITVGRVAVAIKPGSVFSDKVVVRSIEVQRPEITFEGNLQGSNLSKILENVQAFTASESSPGQKSKTGTKKIQVDDFLISGGKINLSMNLLGGKAMTVPLPDIHLTGLGTGSDGITPGELTERVFHEILAGTTKVVAQAVSQLGKKTIGAAKDAGQGVVQQGENITKGLGGLFKKKN